MSTLIVHQVRRTASRINQTEHEAGRIPIQDRVSSHLWISPTCSYLASHFGHETGHETTICAISETTVGAT